MVGAPKTAVGAKDATASIALRPLCWKRRQMRHLCLRLGLRKAVFVATLVVARLPKDATPCSIRATQMAMVGAPKTSVGAKDATASIALRPLCWKRRWMRHLLLLRRLGLMK